MQSTVHTYITHSFTPKGNLEQPIYLPAGGKQLYNLEETHLGTERTYTERPHRHLPKLRIKLEILGLWGRK